MTQKHLQPIPWLTSTPLKTVLSTTISYFACILIVYFAHAHLIPQPDQFNPVGKCTTPPLNCWDGYSKEFNKCITYKKDTLLRSGVVIPAGTENCYKSVYFNLDSTMLAIISWLFLWFYTCSKAFENISNAIFENCARKSVVIALLIDIPTIWYVCAVPVHYLNDRFFAMYNSQLYFSLSELISVVVLIFHVSEKQVVVRKMGVVLGAIALAHGVQLLMDENFLINGSNWVSSGRNMFMFVGDCANLFVAGRLGSGARYWKWICVGAVGQIVIFQILFADFASFKIF